MSGISNEAQNLVQALGGYTNSVIDRVAREARILIPDQLSVPYKTNMYVGGRRVMAVKIALGALPNATTKLVPLPTVVTDVWDQSTAYLDVSNSYGRARSSNVVYPLPHTNVSGFFTSDNGIQVALNGVEVYIRTALDLSDIDGFATVLYLESST